MGWTINPKASRTATSAADGMDPNVATPRIPAAPDAVDASRLEIPGGRTPGIESARAEPAAHDEASDANASAAASATTAVRPSAGCRVAAVEVALPYMCHLFQWCLP
jgi:hypothetical protein